MIREVPTADLVARLHASKQSWAEPIIARLEKRGADEIIRLSVVPARDLYRIYSIRLAAHREAKGPRVKNLEEFVRSLEGDGTVDMFSVADDSGRWFVILREGIVASYVRIFDDDRPAVAT
ncbi:MAG: hypothetical protein EKK34_28440 [Mycobacterium sp.]|nr:MAG: hypothetical protein EKK34_28440 [Mycobacterium sp.]